MATAPIATDRFNTLLMVTHSLDVGLRRNKDDLPDVGRMMTAGREPENNGTLSQLKATPERVRMNTPALLLVPRFRSSRYTSAHSDTNFGNKGALATL